MKRINGLEDVDVRTILERASVGQKNKFRIHVFLVMYTQF